MLSDFIRPREAAIASGTHCQAIYRAINRRRLRVRRRDGKVFILGSSFRRWAKSLNAYRSLRARRRSAH
jgi:hypothetical protein